MSKWLLYCTVVSIIAIGGAIPPASAQFSWPPDLSHPSSESESPASPPQVPPPSAVAKTKNPPAAAGPAVAGNWSGQLSQIGSRTPYKVELSIDPKGAETKYPDLKCTGKLTRIGASKSYVFFVEIITKGASNKGGRCPDGTITMARSGDKLALLWFGNIDGEMIIAYGTLSK
jgi:hypothetical protein